MNRIWLFLLFFPMVILGQSYAPAPGQPGSTAISKDSSVIIGWATGIQLIRGPLDIANVTLGSATFGQDTYALGPAEGDGAMIVSLGDGGSATLTFSLPIMNGPGPDFAVFENGFADNYMEFAFVEVSSDGQNFARFPSFSETPVNIQIDNFMFGDCRYVHNLAGKYRQGYGTPFDLDELDPGIPIDLNAITHVRLVDVVGSIDPLYGTTDFLGNIINDPYPTVFESGGFDLDAVAVLHATPLGISELFSETLIYPNPTNGKVMVAVDGSASIHVVSAEGKLILDTIVSQSTELDLTDYRNSILLVTIQNESGIAIERIVVN